MGLFGCAACKAKDDEIHWLRHELEVERRTRAEVEKPGISRQIEPEAFAPTDAARAVEKPEPVKHEPTFPGYERYEPPKAEIT